MSIDYQTRQTIEAIARGIGSTAVAIEHVAAALNAGRETWSDARLRQNRIEAAAVLAQLAISEPSQDGSSHERRIHFADSAVVLLESAGLSGGAENLPRAPSTSLTSGPSSSFSNGVVAIYERHVDAVEEANVIAAAQVHATLALAAAESSKVNSSTQADHLSSCRSSEAAMLGRFT